MPLRKNSMFKGEQWSLFNEIGLESDLHKAKGESGTVEGYGATGWVDSPERAWNDHGLQSFRTKF